MNIQTEGLLSAAKASSREMCFYGVSAFFGESEDTAFAVGKLYDCSAMSEHRCDSSILFFSSLTQLACALPQIQKGTAAGIVLSARTLNEKAVEALMAYSLPFLVLEYNDSLPEHCFGEIAILDASRGSLTVNPNVGTIKKYSLLIQANGKDVSLFLPNAREIGIAKSAHGDILLRAGSVGSSGELFALLRSFAEANIGRRITVSLGLTHPKLSEERFCDDIESVFLAALYGNISITLEGYRLPSDINRALTLLKHSFCRLIENRREFNGCIKKGLMISAPLWLTQELPMSHPDTVCLELDTLARLSLGAESGISPQHLALLEAPLLSFAKRHQSIPLSAALSESADTPLKNAARELCEAAGIKERYF